MENIQCDMAIMPVRDALDVVGNKWRLLILLSIASGNHRFNAILESIPKLSSKVLSEELRFLEANLLIEKREDIENFWLKYYLTSHAETLEDVVIALQNWGILHRNKILNSL